MSSPFNYFSGWTEEDLLELRTAVQEQGCKGRIVRVTAAGVSTEKDYSFGQRPDVVLRRIERALWLIADADARDPNPYQNYDSFITRTAGAYGCY